MKYIGSIISRACSLLGVGHMRDGERYLEYGRAYASSYVDHSEMKDGVLPWEANPLWNYFHSHREGPGIWKWEHYFEIYHRHLRKYVGSQCNLMEVGIFSGGSLQMWLNYFGNGCHVHGVDIEAACKVYENEHVTVHIGDQGSRAFWRSLLQSISGIDVLIDDGGHEPEQQRITLEEVLPNLKPGGVYICEDIHKRDNKFALYLSAYVAELNGTTAISSFQKCIHSIHFYPYCAVIEKQEHALSRLHAPKRGTLWQPFFGKEFDAESEQNGSGTKR